MVNGCIMNECMDGTAWHGMAWAWIWVGERVWIEYCRGINIERARSMFVVLCCANVAREVSLGGRLECWSVKTGEV